jgi:hypothetical protein
MLQLEGTDAMIIRSPVPRHVIELRETFECCSIEEVLGVYGAKYSTLGCYDSALRLDDGDLSGP